MRSVISTFKKPSGEKVYVGNHPEVTRAFASDSSPAEIVERNTAILKEGRKHQALMLVSLGMVVQGAALYVASARNPSRVLCAAVGAKVVKCGLFGFVNGRYLNDKNKELHAFEQKAESWQSGKRTHAHNHPN